MNAEGKSILIIDTPKDCGDCPCIHDEMWTCQADKQFREGTYSNGIPAWCPLRQMPDKAVETLLKGLDAMEKMQSVEVRTIRRTE